MLDVYGWTHVGYTYTYTCLAALFSNWHSPCGRALVPFSPCENHYNSCIAAVAAIVATVATTAATAAATVSTNALHA